MSAATDDRVVIRSFLADGDGGGLAEDVLDGLTRPFKEIPPKHFYDARGAALFDRICDLPEYYPTRAERAILERHAGEIAARTGACELVELGSGTATKTRILLAAMDALGTLGRYVPIDVTEPVVRACAVQLTARWPALRVHGLVGDFERHLHHLPAPPAAGARLLAFLGGTIGNFPPGSRRRFLRSLANVLRPGRDALLLGTDLVKDPALLEAAYDDAQGVTAEFNRNVLHVINRELDADFDVGAFAHVAFYDRERQWIEMRLRAERRMLVRVGGLALDVPFAPREELRTEISAKFTLAGLDRDLAAAGLRRLRTFADPDDLFALSLAAR